jgi:branched-chain amino acid transport system ATP-binding protein
MTCPDTKPIVEIRGLTKRFGGLRAVNDVSFDLYRSQILGVIGPNGAGKTTLFDLITGLHQPNAGRVFFNGEDITGLYPHTIVRKGISRSFQLEVLFKELSVLQHLMISRHLHTKETFWGSLLRTPSSKKKQKATEDEAVRLAQFVGLYDQQDKLGANLSHGYQRSLGIAMALGTDPKVLLLDEPFSALSPKRVTTVLDLIATIRERGITVMVIEHNMSALLRVCDRVVVLNVGQKIAEGTPDDIKRDERVVKAYLGDAVDV